MNLGADFDNAVLYLDNGDLDFGETINNLLSALAPTIWNQVCVLKGRVAMVDFWHVRPP